MPTVKNPPQHSAPSDPAVDLPKFEEFVEKMESHLTDVRKRERIALLRKIYKEAERKVMLEKSRKQAQQHRFMFRGAHQSMDAAGKKLSQALALLEKVKQDNGEELKQIENAIAWNMTPFSFDGIIQHLRDAMKIAGEMRLAYAGMVHPHLRNPGEKQLAQQGASGGPLAGAADQHNYPAREQSPEIDHWFIGAAAECLDKYRTAKGRTIPRPDKIISHLFEVCFGDTKRDVENVRAELVRQKKHGRPQYTPEFFTELG